jgi:hypothetical protein
MADWLEIEALGEFTASVMMRDYDHVAPLSTPDGGRGLHRHQEHPVRRAPALGRHLRQRNHPHVTFTADYIRPSGACVIARCGGW